MRIVARLKTKSEISLLSQLQVDVFYLDTEFSIKSVKRFDFDEIKEITEEVTKLGKQTYISINKMIHQKDIEVLHDFLQKVKSINVSGIVINDFTVYVLAKEIGIENLVIYQPGSMNTDSYSAEYLREKGFKGMTISREITLSEIQNIIDNEDNLELSLVGHGYLDMFYSLRKLLTNYAKHKKINGLEIRNNHDFRLNEEIRPDDFYPIIEEDYGTIIFRSKKLMSFDEMEHLLDISDFFIERNFMSDEEYHDSIRLYRNQISKEDFLSKYSDYDSGFYYRPTEKLKGDYDES